MAKVLKFDSLSPLAKKVKSETKQLGGKVMAFPRQKLNFQNAEIKTNETIPPTAFFGCF